MRLNLVTDGFKRRVFEERLARLEEKRVKDYQEELTAETKETRREFLWYAAGSTGLIALILVLPESELFAITLLANGVIDFLFIVPVIFLLGWLATPVMMD